VGEIFISYASVDDVLAERIADEIRQAGHRIFRDSDLDDGIAPGADWQRTLFRELRSCDAVVFLNSHAAQKSLWCHSELVVAILLRKLVYSLDLTPNLGRHPLLRGLQGVRFETSIDAGVQRLTDSLCHDGLDAGSRPRWERGRPLYPGLAAMDVAGSNGRPETGSTATGNCSDATQQMLPRHGSKNGPNQEPMAARSRTMCSRPGERCAAGEPRSSVRFPSSWRSPWPHRWSRSSPWRMPAMPDGSMP
jgi:hypothetical protein